MSDDSLRALWRRVWLTVRRGGISLVDDSGVVQLAQARLSAAEVQDDVPRLGEYGLVSVPPAGSDVVAMAMAGDTTNLVIIATGNRTYRLRGLADGEVAIHDDKGQKVYLSAGGIVVESGSRSVTINAGGGMTINGDVVVNGNTTFNGTVTANGHRIDESHKHGGVRGGTDVSGPVT